MMRISLMAAALAILALTGCATQRQPYDYTAFKESNPRSILVLPPLNNTPEVRATYSMYAQVTHPLAESGYYVLPVTLVDEMFKENGLTQPSDIHALPNTKLREIFGADAALYITVTQYGTAYKVFASVTTVTAQARLVDLKTEKVLWTGSASAKSEEGKSQQGGLAGMLISALINQIVNTTRDLSHPMAGVTSQRLLGAGGPNSLLYGPRSPAYGTQ